MRLKSFHGATLTDAMRAVREALGENAIIVATREDDAGGMRVTAAIDEASTTESPTPVSAPAEGSEALETIAEALTRHQVPGSLAEKLMATATQFASDDPLLSLGAAIDTHFKFQPLTDDAPIMLVGPSGAGKTLCTAKLATQATMAKRTPTVISTDTDRAGGMEQLAAFTRLLKVNLVETEDAHAMRDAVYMQKGCPVYIDTAGRNIFDPTERELARSFISAIGDATLVLPAGLDASEGTDIAREYKSLGAKRILVTRLDTVKRIGSLLRIVHDCGLPLCNFSASSRVTEPAAPMNPVVIARMILKNSGEQTQAQNLPKVSGGHRQ